MMLSDHEVKQRRIDFRGRGASEENPRGQLRMADHPIALNANQLSSRKGLFALCDPLFWVISNPCVISAVGNFCWLNLSFVWLSIRWPWSKESQLFFRVKLSAHFMSLPHEPEQVLRMASSLSPKIDSSWTDTLICCQIVAERSALHTLALLEYQETRQRNWKQPCR